MSSSRKTATSSLPKQSREEKRANRISKQAQKKAEKANKKGRNSRKNNKSMNSQTQPPAEPVNPMIPEGKPGGPTSKIATLGKVDPMMLVTVDFNFVSFGSHGKWIGPQNTFEFLDDNKFSVQEWNRVCTFHRLCSALYGAESVSYHKWIPELGDYASLFPHQTSSYNGLSVSTDWADERNQKLLDEFEAKYKIPLFPCCTIHTHVNTGAFQSGTDSKDEEENPGWHITLGKLNNLARNDKMDVHCRLVSPKLARLKNKGGIAVDIPTEFWVTGGEEKDSKHLTPSMDFHYCHLIEQRMRPKTVTYSSPRYGSSSDFFKGGAGTTTTNAPSMTPQMCDDVAAIKEYKQIGNREPFASDVWNQKEKWIKQLINHAKEHSNYDGFPHTDATKNAYFNLYSVPLAKLYSMCVDRGLMKAPDPKSPNNADKAKESSDKVLDLISPNKAKSKANDKVRIMGNLIILDRHSSKSTTAEEARLREEMIRIPYEKLEKFHNKEMKKAGFKESIILTDEDFKKKIEADNPSHGCLQALFDENQAETSMTDPGVPLAKRFDMIQKIIEDQKLEPEGEVALLLYQQSWLVLFRGCYKDAGKDCHKGSYTTSYLREMIDMFILFNDEDIHQLQAHEDIQHADFKTLYGICEVHGLFDLDKQDTEDLKEFPGDFDQDDDEDPDEAYKNWLESQLKDIWKAFYGEECDHPDMWEDDHFFGMLKDIKDVTGLR